MLETWGNKVETHGILIFAVHYKSQNAITSPAHISADSQQPGLWRCAGAAPTAALGLLGAVLRLPPEEGAEPQESSARFACSDDLMWAQKSTLCSDTLKKQ